MQALYQATHSYLQPFRRKRAICIPRSIAIIVDCHYRQLFIIAAECDQEISQLLEPTKSEGSPNHIFTPSLVSRPFKEEESGGPGTHCLCMHRYTKNLRALGILSIIIFICILLTIGIMAIEHTFLFKGTFVDRSTWQVYMTMCSVIVYDVF